MQSLSPDQLPVLYEDEWLIAVHKPSGYFVHRSQEDRRSHYVIMVTVRDYCGSEVFPVHRLDRATSGVVLFARSRESAAALSALFASRTIQKTYRALVRGFTPPAGTIDQPLLTPVAKQRLRHDAADDDSTRGIQEALTEYRTLERFELALPCGSHATTRCSLVTVKPQTGRFHQIRRHFNHISHPILGDTSHGDRRHNHLFRSRLNLTRLMLAATEIQFLHPFTKQPIKISSALSQDFQLVLDQMLVHTAG